MSVYDLMSKAHDDAPEEYNCYLQGDLSQMSTQMNLLTSNGIDVQVSGGIPCIKESDFNKAMQLIYDNETEGWWNYKDTFINCKICTRTEFKHKLG